MTATVAGYALDGAPASVPDLIRAARAAGIRIPYPGIDPLPATYATGPSVQPVRPPALTPQAGLTPPPKKGDIMARKPQPDTRDTGDNVGPTPETAAKLRRDIVVRLAQEGRLGGEQVAAALEVRRVWEAFGRGLFPSTNTLAPVAGRRKQAMFIDPIDRLTRREEAAWRLRYRPWAREMAVTVAAGAIRTSRLQLILDIVVDNHGLREVEGWYRMRHGGAIEHIRAALHRCTATPRSPAGSTSRIRRPGNRRRSASTRRTGWEKKSPETRTKTQKISHVDKFCLTRDAFRGIFPTVEKWGRRRYRRPFFVPHPSYRPEPRPARRSGDIRQARQRDTGAGRFLHSPRSVETAGRRAAWIATRHRTAARSPVNRPHLSPRTCSGVQGHGRSRRSGRTGPRNKSGATLGEIARSSGRNGAWNDFRCLATVFGAESEGRKKAVKSGTYQMIYPEQAFSS